MISKNLVESEFYKLPKWVVDIKGLQPADMIIYCIAYNHNSLSEMNDKVDEEGRVYFYLTHESLKSNLGLGRNQIQYSLKRLKQCGAIIPKKRKNGKAAEYYLETDKKKIMFDITSLKKGTAQIKTTEIDTAPIPKFSCDHTEKGTSNQSEKSATNKKEYNKKEISEIDEIRKGLLTAAITPLLKDKLMEYIDYREQIGKPIKRYKAIELTINQIGSTFIDEQHLIDSIDETFMYEYQGIFPAKLKRLTATDKVESTAMKRLRKLREEQNSERGDIS